MPQSCAFYYEYSTFFCVCGITNLKYLVEKKIARKGILFEIRDENSALKGDYIRWHKHLSYIKFALGCKHMDVVNMCCIVLLLTACKSLSCSLLKCVYICLVADNVPSYDLFPSNDKCRINY